MPDVTTHPQPEVSPPATLAESSGPVSASMLAVVSGYPASSVFISWHGSDRDVLFDTAGPNAGLSRRSERTPVAELIAHQDRAYDTLLNRSAKAQKMMKRERVVWTWLTLIALTTGFITGLSYAVAGFPIDPPSATFAFLATIGLVITLRVHGASR